MLAKTPVCRGELVVADDAWVSTDRGALCTPSGRAHGRKEWHLWCWDMGEKVAVGDVLADKYRVERVLGAGGMGVVVAARHVHLDVLVALKFMSDEALKHPELVERFTREARAAARLRSDHVARVTDIGTLESGVPYQVIEYLEGSDLAALLVRDGALSVSRAAEYTVQVCDALDEAHGAGIVHRDIKPSNLFLTTRRNGSSCIKVLDFGISKFDWLNQTTARLRRSHSGALLGSPFYMAPEQMRGGGQVDARTDVWALGATLYELLAGSLPFQAESLVELALQVVEDEPRPLREVRPEVPWELEQLVLRCLQKDPEDRFRGARALALALAPFAPAGVQALFAELRDPWHEGTLVEDGAEEPDTRVVSMAMLRDVHAGGRAKSGSLPPSKTDEIVPPPQTDEIAPTVGSMAAPKTPPARPMRDILAIAALCVASGSVVWGPHAPLAMPAARDVGEAAASAPSESLAAAAAPQPSSAIPTVSVSDLPTAALPPPSREPTGAANATSASARPVGPPDASAPSFPVLPVPPADKANCTPPYVIDAMGHMHFKRECLNDSHP